jgi:hypothetical protein
MDVSEAPPVAVASTPVHALRDYLKAERLRIITDAARVFGESGVVDGGSLGALAHVQIALQAVQEEIQAHSPRLGAGSEQPLG